MAKLVKKKRRRLSLFGVSLLMFSFSICLYLITSLFVNTRNAALTMRIQNANMEIAMISDSNKSLNIQIQTLENKDRVYTIAEESNMQQVQNNVISVQGE